MNTIIRITAFLLVLQLNAANNITEESMPDYLKVEEAKIENGIIPNAMYYHLIKGGTTVVWDQTPEPIQVANAPQAFFYTYSTEKKESKFLGAITIKEINDESIEKLNKFIDSNTQLPAIKKAVIASCIKRGRFVTFYDAHDNEIDSCYHYSGTGDIRHENSIQLPQPPSILNALEKVEERKLDPNQYKIMALFSPRFVKEITTYDDLGNASVEVVPIQK